MTENKRASGTLLSRVPGKELSHIPLSIFRATWPAQLTTTGLVVQYMSEILLTRSVDTEVAWYLHVHSAWWDMGSSAHRLDIDLVLEAYQTAKTHQLGTR